MTDGFGQIVQYIYTHEASTIIPLFIFLFGIWLLKKVVFD